MQLHGRGRGRAQHILQGRQAGVVLGGQLGLLLLEDGQSEHITATHRREQSGAEPHGAQAQRQRAKSEKWVLTWGIEGNTPKPMAACLWGAGGAPRPHATPVSPEPGHSRALQRFTESNQGGKNAKLSGIYKLQKSL